MSDTTEKAIDATADMAAEVAQQAEAVEQFVRSMNKVKVQFGLLGAAAGATAGSIIAFVIAYRKAEAKYREVANTEIEEMRQHYQNKALALDAKIQKEDLESIVTERGYAAPTTGPPMAVQPPAGVAEREDDVAGEPPDDSEMAEEPEPEVRNVFEEARVDHEWDYHRERRLRSPDVPYVIHYDERKELDYQEVTLTYYEGDDVLCTERDEVVDPDKRNELIGERSLSRFGHGSNDASIVYVRNDQLELVYEVVKSPNSYAEEVHGFSHDAYFRGNVERMRARERDEPDED